MNFHDHVQCLHTTCQVMGIEYNIADYKKRCQSELATTFGDHFFQDASCIGVALLLLGVSSSQGKAQLAEKTKTVRKLWFLLNTSLFLSVFMIFSH